MLKIMIFSNVAYYHHQDEVNPSCRQYNEHLYDILMQVSTNGYISMENEPSNTKFENFPLPDAYKIVAPFAHSIDLSIGGSVTYTDFSEFTFIHSQLNDVSEFVEERIAYLSFFLWKRMMVVQWNNVSQSGGSSVSSCLHVVNLCSYHMKKGQIMHDVWVSVG